MKLIPIFIVSVFLSINVFAQTDTLITKDWLLGKIKYHNYPEFVEINIKYTDRSKIYLHKYAYNAYVKMFAAAKEDGVHLVIRSAARNFAYQEMIWNKKWNNTKFKQLPPKERAVEILKYSSMPGTSRHHWGTDIDLNDFNNSYFENGNGKKVYDWLNENAPDFGFYQTYTDKSTNRTGYEEEKWHWSYLPLSMVLLKQYNSTITYNDLKEVNGASFAEHIKIIEKYVNGINPIILDID